MKQENISKLGHGGQRSTDCHRKESDLAITTKQSDKNLVDILIPRPLGNSVEKTQNIPEATSLKEVSNKTSFSKNKGGIKSEELTESQKLKKILNENSKDLDKDLEKFKKDFNKLVEFHQTNISDKKIAELDLNSNTMKSDKNKEISQPHLTKSVTQENTTQPQRPNQPSRTAQPETSKPLDSYNNDHRRSLPGTVIIPPALPIDNGNKNAPSPIPLNIKLENGRLYLEGSTPGREVAVTIYASSKIDGVFSPLGEFKSDRNGKLLIPLNGNENSKFFKAEIK